MYFKILKIKDNPFGYKFNIQIWKSSYYTGSGKFFKTKAEAKKYLKVNSHIKVKSGISYVR